MKNNIERLDQTRHSLASHLYAHAFYLRNTYTPEMEKIKERWLREDKLKGRPGDKAHVSRARRPISAATSTERLYSLYQPWSRSTISIMAHLTSTTLRSPITFIDLSSSPFSFRAVVYLSSVLSVLDRFLHRVLGKGSFTLGKVFAECHTR